MTAEKILVYRDAAERVARSEPSFRYVIANQALDEVRMQALRGEQPSEPLITGVRHRFEAAALANQESNPFVHYRARLLGAYIIPIVYGDVVNIGLSASQAHRVSEHLDIRGAYDESLEVARDALERLDEVAPQGVDIGSDESRAIISLLSGFLHETSAISLVNRKKSGKQFAVPTTAYDDEFQQRRSVKADGILYDQRPKGTHRRKNPFQVKASADGTYSIPVITSHDMANQTKASAWPHHDEKFTTLRMLIRENDGDELDEHVRPTLDRLSGFVVRKMIN